MGRYNNIDSKNWVFKMASICWKYICLRVWSYVMAACDVTCYCVCVMWGTLWGRRQSWALSIGHGCCGYRLWLKKHYIYVALTKGKKSSTRWSNVRDTQCAFYTGTWKTLMSFHHKTMNVLDLKCEPLNTEECMPIYALVSEDP